MKNKRRNYVHYGKYSGLGEPTPADENLSGLQEETAPEIQEEESVVNEPVKEEEPVAKENVSSAISGKVFNCITVNLRFDPSPDSDIKRIVDAGVNVSIDLEKSTEDYYYVFCDDFSGYINKAYVERSYV